MAEYVRALIQYPRDTGLPGDVQTNSLYFFSILNDRATLASHVRDRITDFVQSFDQVCPTGLFQSGYDVDLYDMSDPEPRVPFDSWTTAFGTTAGNPLVEEASCVLSFQGEPMSGVPQARRRGRIYLPTFLATTVITTVGKVLWSPATVTLVSNAGSGLLNDTLDFDDYWAVFSATTFADTADLELSFVPIHDGWVDNAPDTQRRRGGLATSRTTFTS